MFPLAVRLWWVTIVIIPVFSFSKTERKIKKTRVLWTGCLWRGFAVCQRVKKRDDVVLPLVGVLWTCGDGWAWWLGQKKNGQWDDGAWCRRLISHFCFTPGFRGSRALSVSDRFGRDVQLLTLNFVGYRVTGATSRCRFVETPQLFLFFFLGMGYDLATGSQWGMTF